ncbi:SHOCT domain-containing protein [Agromyces sp. MMS24-K17]|uniref:SHOCT domain-containing protein n=1 Tax=Agromyces sp. MMS24-K17 TaxID=3372850 RepID=UPI0037541432
MADETTGVNQQSEKQGFFAKAGAAIKRAAEEAQERAREGREAAGPTVHRADFGGTMVEIFGHGYVRVGSLGPHERLRSIKHSYQVQDKSAGGRAVVGMMTMGANYLASKEKRVVFLTIATDTKVHTLKATGGMARSADKAAMALEAAGQAVLDGLAQQSAAAAVHASATAGEQTLDQLKKLGELHAAGVVTDDEFAAKKADLLRRI